MIPGSNKSTPCSPSVPFLWNQSTLHLAVSPSDLLELDRKISWRISAASNAFRFEFRGGRMGGGGILHHLGEKRKIVERNPMAKGER